MPETGCSCSRLPQLSLLEDTTELLETLQNVLPRIATARFVFHSPWKIEKAKKLCGLAREFCGSVVFRHRMHELNKDLARLCDGKSSSNKLRKDVSAYLKPFRTKNLDIDAVSRELRRKISAVLAPSEIQEHGMGFIYILRSLHNASTMAELKIGFSKYHPENRAQELGRCLTRPEIVGHTPLLPHARRIESIIHTELVAYRKVQSCGQCGRNHREWFTISHASAREVVTRWSRWILRRPYREGKLNDEWRVYLEGKDFSSVDPGVSLASLWSETMDKFPKCPQEEQVGAYLNACYHSSMVRQLAGLQEHDFEGLISNLQNRKIIHNGGKAYEIEDYRDIFDSLTTSIRTDAEAQPFDSDPSRLPTSLKESSSWIEELVKTIETVRATKTGAISVSDPELGISESPMGDATMLPVVTLEELKHFDAPVRNWVGYNPTHAGFQYLQEAYQSGKWMGRKPHFNLPKGFRKAGISKLSDLPCLEEQDVEAGPSTQPVFQHCPKQSAIEEELANMSFSENTADQTYKADEVVDQKGSSFLFTRGPGKDTFRWSTPMTDEFTKKVEEGIELIRNGRRAEVERKLEKAFRYWGVDYGGDSDDDSLSSLSSNSEIPDDESTVENIVEDTHSDTKKSRHPSKTVTRPENDTSRGVAGVTKDKARRWLECL